MTTPASDHTKSPHVSGELVAGKYELERLLSDGGMGSVWRARNIALDAHVALKLLRSEVDDGTMRTRLLQEAYAVARLRHPAIVRVFDVAEASSGLPFMVMELLEGCTLADLIEREGRVDVIDLLRMMLPIADALALAHRGGIVHRDVKPENVFLAQDADHLQPKLIDFGIAKLKPEQHGFKRARHLTHAGTTVGSLEYMAPEQAYGASDIDQRADIWAFSVVLYQGITGKLPFDAETQQAVLCGILEHEPPTIAGCGAADDDLWNIVRRGLQKRRDERWPSMHDYGIALANWLVERGVRDDICGTALSTKWLTQVPIASSQRTQPRGGVPPSSTSKGKPPAHARRRGSRPIWTAAGAVMLSIAGWTVGTSKSAPRMLSPTTKPDRAAVTTVSAAAAASEPSQGSSRSVAADAGNPPPAPAVRPTARETSKQNKAKNHSRAPKLATLQGKDCKCTTSLETTPDQDSKVVAEVDLIPPY